MQNAAVLAVGGGTSQGDWRRLTLSWLARADDVGVFVVDGAWPLEKSADDTMDGGLLGARYFRTRVG